MARQFTATNLEYLTFDGTIPVTAVPLTVSIWANPNETTIEESPWNIVDSGLENQYFMINIRGDFSAEVDFATRATTYSAARTSNTITAGVWNHICGSTSAIDSRRCILNGDTVNKGTDTTSRTPTGIDRLTIGRAGDSTPNIYFNGLIAECAMWDIELTEPEVVALSKGITPLLIRPQSLVYYDPLIRGLADESSNDVIGGISLTATNTVPVAPHPAIIQPSAQILQFPSAAVPWTQDQYRFGADDGNEASHGWIAAQNTDINQAGSTPAILRIQATTGGDQPTQQMKLQVKKTSDADSFYADVPVA